MIQLPQAIDLELLAVRAGLTMAQACKRAGLSPQVFTGWKSGARKPNLGSLDALLDVLNRAISERAKQEHDHEQRS